MFFQFAPLAQQFLIHYGWRGTFSSTCATTRGHRVSNPLRLEGDIPADAALGPKLFVSNPLRLEGDDRGPDAARQNLCVSNPLRLEGDRMRLIGSFPVPMVSNPLRLEGDK